MKVATLVAATALCLGGARPAQAAPIVYDLAADFSYSSNPQGAWSFVQGNTALPLNNISVCCSPSDGISTAWAPSGNPGNFLPFWTQATANTSGPYGSYSIGDILVHSVDGGNGNPGLGETSVLWTAPFTGTIAVSGGLWYAHGGIAGRSNDFSLFLGPTSLFTGTVSWDDIYDRSSPNGFSATGLHVTAGDVLRLTVQRTSPTNYGTISGVNLTITETPQTVVPEPATVLLMGTGLATIVSRKRRRQPSASSTP